VTFEALWRSLLPVGRSTRTGGYFRSPFGSAERECMAWFVEQAESRGLSLEHDGQGNAVAWFNPADVELVDAVVTGSHLDSVTDGGAFDGPLGVVTALAALDRIRDNGLALRRPVGISVFVEEEGSRFGLACLGSRLATGATAPDRARDLRDRAGRALVDAMAAAGLEPALGPAAFMSRIGTFVELHVEQGRDLVHRGAAVAVGSMIWPHGRFRFDFTGQANHAGTTGMDERHDPMLTYAMTALAANKQARRSGTRATFGRVEVEPNGTNAVPSRVSGWLDARAASADALDDLVATVTERAVERAARDGTAVARTDESVSGRVDFDPALANRLSAVLGDAPRIATGAGHDAGVLAAAGIPTAMLFVRNPSGVSHSPAEHADPADCLAGVDALTAVLSELAG
jgi:beta-ureidopropionase / N-carbamoyl-L-amino-acid hydrolase